MSTAGGAVYVGVDRADDAWFAVAFDDAGFDHAEVFPEIGDLWAEYEESAARIHVDVPIGLVTAGEAERQCDEQARTVLGPQRDAVVAPPAREATRKRRYPAANRVNRRKTGRSLTREAFAISDAIAAVDELLQNVPEARSTFVASHPEVCFRAFAGEPLDRSREFAAGYAERMRTLAQHDRDAPPAVQAAAEATGGHEIGVADVLDATALAYTARPGAGELRSLPPDPPTDAAGLPMQVVYRSETPLDVE